MFRPSVRSVASKSSNAAPKRLEAAYSPSVSPMSSAAMPAPVQALALWRSISVASAPRHSSRRARAISPEMSCGGGRVRPYAWNGRYASSARGVSQYRGWRSLFCGPRLDLQPVGVSWRRFIAISVA
jgi:hypothetical protein